MIYDMLKKDVVKRIMDAFYTHDECVNRKYETFRKENRYWYSDRDRFAGRFFSKYRGRYFMMVDRELIAFKYDTYFVHVDPYSVFSCKPNGTDYGYSGSPVNIHRKKYLRIAGFRAVNEMYGRGYVEMSCTDQCGNSVLIRLDECNMRYIQFKEISEAEFETIAKLFEDDRDEVPFKVTRYMDYDEMKKCGKENADHPVKEEVTIMARDDEEARSRSTNVIEVEPC